MTLLTVFKVMLYRYSGQEDICVGSPIAGPGAAGDRGADRFFRKHAGAAERSWGEADVQGAAASGEADPRWRRMKHQDVPFEKGGGGTGDRA